MSLWLYCSLPLWNRIKASTDSHLLKDQLSATNYEIVKTLQSWNASCIFLWSFIVVIKTSVNVESVDINIHSMNRFPASRSITVVSHTHTQSHKILTFSYNTHTDLHRLTKHSHTPLQSHKVFTHTPSQSHNSEHINLWVLIISLFASRNRFWTLLRSLSWM